MESGSRKPPLKFITCYPANGSPQSTVIVVTVWKTGHLLDEIRHETPALPFEAVYRIRT